MPVIGSGQWRMCDRAAIALSPLLGGRRMSLSPSLALTQRDQFIVRVRDAVKKVQAGEPVPKVQPGPPAPNIRPVPLLR